MYLNRSRHLPPLAVGGAYLTYPGFFLSALSGRNLTIGRHSLLEISLHISDSQYRGIAVAIAISSCAGISNTGSLLVGASNPPFYIVSLLSLPSLCSYLPSPYLPPYLSTCIIPISLLPSPSPSSSP